MFLSASTRSRGNNHRYSGNLFASALESCLP